MQRPGAAEAPSAAPYVLSAPQHPRLPKRFSQQEGRASLSSLKTKQHGEEHWWLQVTRLPIYRKSRPRVYRPVATCPAAPMVTSVAAATAP